MNHKNGASDKNQYLRLLVMTVLSFVSMYIFMYSMVNSMTNVYSSFNQVYMAGLMTAPMIIIELLVMWAMYPDRKLNLIVLAGSAVALAGFFMFIRQQASITDKQFLRSMIPHHAGAILMCEQSSAESPAIKKLCKNILASQQAEIAQMKALLSELDR